MSNSTQFSHGTRSATRSQRSFSRQVFKVHNRHSEVLVLTWIVSVLTRCCSLAVHLQLFQRVGEVFRASAPNVLAACSLPLYTLFETTFESSQPSPQEDKVNLTERSSVQCSVSNPCSLGIGPRKENRVQIDKSFLARMGAP